jgi:lipoprotein-releasing system ATP-binding protein
MTEPLLQARGIKKSFTKDAKVLNVINGIDLDIYEGERVAVTGASGAGKSTLLHILGTLESPTAGDVYFAGQRIFPNSSKDLSHFRNQSLGFVFQFHYLLPEFSALENTMMPGLISGRNKKEVKERVESFIQDLKSKHKETDTILVITHSNPIRIFSMIVEDISFEEVLKKKNIKNAEYILYEI